MVNLHRVDKPELKPLYERVDTIRRGINGLEAEIEHLKAEKYARDKNTMIKGTVSLAGGHRVVHFNKAVTDMTGYTLSDVRGREGRALARGGELDSLFDAIAELMSRDGGWRGELNILRKNGTLCPIHCNATPIRDESGKIFNWGVFVTDMSERKASEARLASLANIDQLTKLPNRPGFAKLLTELLAAGKGCAVVFVDVDQLARVNDAYGHQAGDLLLTTIAGRLRRLLHSEHILGHLGRCSHYLHVGWVAPIHIYPKMPLPSLANFAKNTQGHLGFGLLTFD